ncbi:MAG: DNA polymerase III subunit alpha [Pseudomonadales bacterium]|nr:DNA polymerase III subunit alpha [Pseudomonadales bacterium]
MDILAKPTEFAELHTITNYSFLRGASHPEELVKQAHKLGYRAIAITDECTYAGLVKAHLTAKDLGIKLIVGAEFNIQLNEQDPSKDEHLNSVKIILLATDRATYGQISALISKLRRRADKGTYEARLDDFRFGMKGCLALWALPIGSIDNLIIAGQQLQSIFSDLWIALELFQDGHDLDKTANALTTSIRLDLPIVASNDVHTHTPQRQPLQDLVSAIRLRTTVHELGSQAFSNAERSLRPIEHLKSLYPPEFLAESLVIADRCEFCMDELRYEYPKDLVPPHLTPSEYLRQLTYAGASERWPDTVGGIDPATRELVEKELDLIAELNYEYYFLTVQDIVQFARSQGILCQGRGSAANSAVCYCLHVTEVDPARMHLLFERFVSKERNEPPDIDVDFEHERREEVIQYIYKRYGRDRAALAATLICYRPKSAIRDVGKALGLDLDVIDLLAKSMAWWDKKDEIPERLRAVGLDPDSRIAEQFLFFVSEILGFPRHLSQHVGGFVISRGPLAQLVPVENAAMDDRTVIQWDKDDLEALGLLKVDVLALGMLTAIRKAFDVINDYKGTELSIQKIPAEDPETYHMLQRGDSVGVFQVESRAQMAMLPRLKPQHFYDLVIEVAIVRPGPIQGDMVHPYLRRRQGLEPIHYPSAGVQKVLERTLGVPIFQEQVIELAMVAAGFSAGEADQLRRAMAAWKKRGGLEHFEQKLIDGMQERGHDRSFAERVFKQIQGFGEYGFPESHAASFALLVYVSSWLKCHEPAAFYCGLLNSLPMGFYSPSQLIQDAKRHHIEIRDIDVTLSQWSHTLEVKANQQPALRLGLRMVKGFREEVADQLIATRAKVPFASAEDLAVRAGINDQAMKFLARAGALTSISGHRHQAHWQVAGVERPMPINTPLIAAEEPAPYNFSNEQDSDINLPSPSPQEDLISDYRYTGLTLGPHPMQLLRHEPQFTGYRTAADLETYRQGQNIRVAGLVTGRQRPGTATGVVFLTLEDETGNINIVIWSTVLERFRAIWLQGQLLKIKGIVEREGRVIHVVAGAVEDGTKYLRQMKDTQPALYDLGELPFKSRDFH